MSLFSSEIVVLVLAAGQGKRMGGKKLLLPHAGKPLLLHAVDAALAMRRRCPVFIVTGSDGPEVRNVLAGVTEQERIRVVDNARWKDGMSSSLRLGIASIVDSTVPETLRGVLVMLGDQPLVRADTLDLLAAHHLAANAPATVPVLGERRGNPVVLAPSLFSRIDGLHGDRGARDILAAIQNDVMRVPVTDPGIFQDIDSPEDYQALQAGG